jgi:hypothetical protein
LILLAGAADIKQELRASGFIQLRDFVQFGNSRLWNRLTEAENNHRDALGEVDRNHRTALSEAENNLRTADAFDRTTAQAALDSVKTQIEAAKTAVTNKHEALVADITIQMKTVTKEFAPKTFIGEYPFTTMDVQVNGNTSSFTMVIPAGFVGAKIGEVVIPVPNVTGRSGSSARQATAPIRHQDNNEYIAFLLGDNRIFMALLSRHSNRISRHPSCDEFEMVFVSTILVSRKCQAGNPKRSLVGSHTAIVKTSFAKPHDTISRPPTFRHLCTENGVVCARSRAPTVIIFDERPAGAPSGTEVSVHTSESSLLFRRKS